MKPRLEFIVPGDPVPCARARVVAVRGPGGKPLMTSSGEPIVRAFTPDTTTEYEQRVALFASAALAKMPEWKAAFAQRLPIRVHLHVVRRQWRGDWDNFAKGLCDGLAKSGSIFDNDNRITQALISMHTDPRAEPRAEVTIETASATLDEPLWMRCAREAGWRPPLPAEVG